MRLKGFLLLVSLLVSLHGFSQTNLPLDFEASPGSYPITNFDGGMLTVIANPQSGGINTSPQVAQMVKSAGQVWGGAFVQLTNPIDFSVNKLFKMKVYSPKVGGRVLLKVENASNGGIFFEKEDTTTVANAWEELTFDYSAINTAESYSKVVLICDLGIMGDGSANFTYLFDDIELTSGGGGTSNQIDLPVTFEDPNVDYTLTDFGGNASTVVTDPTDPNNTVSRTVKTPSAQLWAGTSIGTPAGFANAIPFSATETKMTVMVWSPAMGVPVRLKVEDATNNTITCETETMTTVAGGWQMMEFDFTNPVSGTPGLNTSNTYDLASIFFNFGADGATVGADSVYYWDNVMFVTTGGPVLSQINLPVTFEDTTVDYTLTDFGGNASSVVTDPTDPNNTVGRSVKTPSAQLWAGTTIGTPAGFANAVPFSATETKMTVRVWSPVAGAPIRLKVEDATNNTITCETEDTTTVAGGWEMLEFDFSNPVSGTAALDINNTYDLASIFFNFGADGAAVGADSVYYWDDVMFVMAPVPDQIDLPVTFEDTTVDYTLTDFGGNASSVVTDPTDPNNTVGRSVKTPSAQLWAGTTIGTPAGFANAVPFSATETKMTVRVWSPVAGAPIRLKVEDATNNTITCETEDTTTVAGGWEMLEFDFSNPVSGTASLDINNTYDLASIFFNFGADGTTVGADSVYYWDDVMFVTTGGPVLSQIDLPVTFEDSTVDYTLTDFGGNASSVVVDPTDPNNTVGRSVKTPGAQLWAGTTIGTPAGFANAIPFTSDSTGMTVRVWSPAAGIPVRLKVEDHNNNTITCETEATTTVANDWQLMEFNFSNPVAGTPALDFAQTYDLASIFFYFGTDGAGVGADSVYYWDDVEFKEAGTSGPTLNQIDLTVTFEDTTVDYTLTDFGGNASSVVEDPTNSANTVARTVKTPAAQTWAGTTIGTPAGFANPIPFMANETKMTVRVWSPVAGAPIRLKVEDATNNTITCETEDTTTVAGDWEIMEFDFNNPVSGTPALDFAQTYDLASIFFNFGVDGAGVGADSVYYWDDVSFGPDTTTTSILDLEQIGFEYYPNPVNSQLSVRAERPIDQLVIYNMMGQMVMNRSNLQNSTTLELSTLEAGVYILRVIGRDFDGSVRIIKQ